MPESSQTGETRAKLVRYAANILSRKPYFRHQLRQKLVNYSLQKELENYESVVDSIVDDLGKSGYLDDQYLADAYVRRQLDKCYGPKIIRYKLKMLGLSDTQIHNSLESEANPEAIGQSIEKMTKKFRLSDPQKLRQKLYQRGF